MDYVIHSDHAFTLTKFFSKSECDAQIRRSEALGFSEATVDTGLSTGVATDVRSNDRVVFDDPTLARLCWDRCKHYVPRYPGGWKAVELNERFRIYRYLPGQVFRWHRDGSFQRSSRERSLMTVLIYLNDQFTGGETSFSEFTVSPSLGLALFFDHTCVHEGSEVVTGKKYVLRTDVMFRKCDASIDA